jgi:hypothetical protein
MRRNTVSEMQRFINLKLGVYFTYVRLCLRWLEGSQTLKRDLFNWMPPNCDTWSSNSHFLPSCINCNRIHSSKFTNFSFLWFNPLQTLTTLPFTINLKSSDKVRKSYFAALCFHIPIPMAARSEAWICGRSLAGITGSNPAGCMDVCILWILYVVS